MAQYRKKPVVIEAFQLPTLEEGAEPFMRWAEDVGFANFNSDYDGGIAIPTLEGTMRGDPGDWIIRGVAGEFYPCKPDIFTATYDPVE